jgi:uncharacterized protein YdeI (YjbR/CyaY-like superfamily)
MPATPKKPHPTLPFPSPVHWEKWLEKHHTTSDGIWMQLFKKASGKQTITYDESVEVALCFGWIDGQKKSKDEESWLQKFTPRRKRSMWSKRNIGIVKRLIKEKRMREAGLREAKAAEQDGRWAQAYDGSSMMTMPEDFLAIVSKNKKMKATFDTLNKANTYAIAWRLATAKKPETRERRMKLILDMLKRGESPHLMKPKKKPMS